MTRHKFTQSSWLNGRFKTENAILQTTPYEPEAIIIGTFNPGEPFEDNYADFFYGRNYFWRVLDNLVSGNVGQDALNGNRILANGMIRTPQLNSRIFDICSQMKLTFADVILSTKDDIVPNSFADKELNDLGLNEHLVSNDQNIIDYINRKPSIKYIYATTKFNGNNYLHGLWNNIIQNINRPVTFGSIVTPSGQGHSNFPGLHRADTKARYWVWVNDPLRPEVQWDGYIHFDHAWLIRSGINPDLF